MRTLAATFLVLLLAHGAFGDTFVDDSFESPAMGGQTIMVRIYLPTGYDPDGPPYRLYVFLHGAGTNNHILCSGMMMPALNNMIDGGFIDPMVVVWPWGRGADFYNIHYWTDSERNGDYESLVVEDLLNWLDDSPDYNVSELRQERAVGGFSMGGCGSIRMAIRNSEKFIAYVSHAGSPAVQEFRNAVPYVIGESPEPEPPYTYHPDNGEWTRWFFGLSSAFSPNMDNPPWYLDFPLLPSGEMDEAVFTDRWIANHDPATLIQDPEVYTNELAMYFEVGTMDESYPWNTRFDEELTALGVEHTFNTFVGGHEMPVERVETTLVWLDGVMDSAAADIPNEEQAQRQSGPVLRQNYPNPVVARTAIRFRLDGPSPVKLDIFDAEGRRVATPLAGLRLAGTHEARWDATSMAAGVYLYRLTTSQGSVSRSLIVAR